MGRGVVLTADAGACPAVLQGGRSELRSWLAWLVPDVAMVAAIVTLFYCLFLFEGYQKLFRDSDAGWHIRTGEAILAGQGLPRADPYSFTRFGQPWVAWEWGADVLMGAAHSLGGLSGVALLYGCAIAAGVWLWFRLTWRAGGDFLLAGILAILLLSTANLHWLARPHVFGWIFLLLAVRQAEEGAPRLWPSLLLGAVWANFHASFVLGAIVFFAYAAGNRVRMSVFGDGPGWRRAAAAGAALLAGSLANPYGWQLHRHVLSYLSDSELLRRVGEYQSFDFHADGAVYILGALAVAALGGAASLHQRRFDRFFLTVLLTVWALRSARGLPIVALALLPLANGAITAALRAARGLRPVWRVRLNAVLDYSANLRRLDRGGHGLAWAAVAVVACGALLETPGIAARTGFPPDQFPVAAAAHIPLDARLLAPDKFGGYLIYRFEGRLKVFFDGRSDLYGAGFLKDYGRLAQVRPGWREALGRHGFTHALLPNDYSLAPALESLGWRVIYRDATASLLAGPPRRAARNLLTDGVFIQPSALPV